MGAPSSIGHDARVAMRSPPSSTAQPTPVFNPQTLCNEERRCQAVSMTAEYNTRLQQPGLLRYRQILNGR
jgi:hypothetical protein